jgi:hypothetical protein
MLPVKRYLAMNTFCYQQSYSLQLKGLRPLLFDKSNKRSINLETEVK